MPPAKNYGINEHRRAFELYKELRTLAAVSEKMEIPYSTIQRWNSANFSCPCPWHNWPLLMQKVDSGEDAVLSLSPLQQMDPLMVDAAVRGEDLPKRETILTRSDLERLGELEFLWAKFYYEITGIVLDVSTLIDAGGLDTKEATDEMTKKYLRGGLPCKSADTATRTLLAIGHEIEEVKERLGLTTAARKGDVTKESTEKQEMTMDDLHRIKEMLANTSPDKLKAMKDLMASEERALQGSLIHE